MASITRDSAFGVYMAEVDRIIAARLGGLVSADLPDYNYADAFDDGDSPGRTARAAIRTVTLVP